MPDARGRADVLNLAIPRAGLRDGDGAGIRVAVLDTGIESAHPALQGVVLADDVILEGDGPRVRVRDGAGEDAYGHGTAIAGIIHALAPRAVLGSFRVLGADLASRSAIIAAGVRLAMDRGYHVLNCSFGCRGEATYVLSFKEWVDEAYLRQVHVVSACSNVDIDRREWPAHFPTVVAVNMARTVPGVFHHLPDHLVEFATGGQEVPVAWSGGGTKTVTGSSYAAPVMSALLARLLSRTGPMHPVIAKSVLRALAEPWSEGIAARNVRRAVVTSAVRVPPAGAP
ncbi:MAG: S8 family serine peptidase [Gemmatimonadaceae bacterium]|nr:S8 family serine peptidase [Gemmatimonadaceae bacterium]